MMLAKKALLFLAVVSVVAFAVLSIVSPNLVTMPNNDFTLSGIMPKALKAAKPVKRSDPNQIIRIVVDLAMRSQAQAEALKKRQADPASPDYQKWLGPLNQFNPTQQDYDLVVHFLTANGLTIEKTYPDHYIVVASGKRSVVENALKVKFIEYELLGKRRDACNQNPVLPGYLKGVVDYIGGLNGFAEFHAMHRPWLRVKAVRHPAPGNGQNPPKKSAQDEIIGYTPQQIATAYNFPNVNNSAGGTKYSGKGRKVAIATAFTYVHTDPKHPEKLGDVDAFRKDCHIVRTGAVIDKYPAGVTQTLNDETTLDLEQVSSQAPGADVLMYMGNSQEDASFEMVFNQIALDNEADVVSFSWGYCEEGFGAKAMTGYHTLYLELALQGIPVFSASGDDGAYDCPVAANQPSNSGSPGTPPSKNNVWIGSGFGHVVGRPAPVAPPATKTTPVKKIPKLAVDYPASDPVVTGVGGTSLLLKENNSRDQEIAWLGAGGGVSDFWSQPDWQKGLPAPFGTDGKRNSADVALVADPLTCYAMYYQGDWVIFAGGTSFAAPNWAALWVLADEAAGRRLGSSNETIYRLANSPQYSTCFVDIVNGNNGNLEGPGYKAGRGWDPPTGWGVPNGANLVEWLKENCKPAHSH